MLSCIYSVRELGSVSICRWIRERTRHRACGRVISHVMELLSYYTRDRGFPDGLVYVRAKISMHTTRSDKI